MNVSNGLLFLSLFATVYGIALSQDVEKTWLFAVGGNRRPGNFIDEDGVLQGFDVDLIRGVCRVARQKCAITVQPYTECIRTVSGRFFPGVGIMAGYYDACTGYTITQDRINSMAFTDPFKSTISTFTVRQGNPTNFSLETLPEATIGHLQGAATNEQCLHRLGYSVKKVLVIDTIIEAKAALANGTVDALFSPRSGISPFETLPYRLKCDLGGIGMMVKQDSRLPDWWNPAFKETVRDGWYQKLCEDSVRRYGSNVTNCLEFPEKGLKTTLSTTNGSSKNGNVLSELVSSVAAYFV